MSESPIASQNEFNVFASMPRDVLLKIMEEDIQEAGGVGNTLSVDSPVWRLGQVCTHWRETLRTHPLLWSRMNIILGDYPNVQARAIESRFRQLIQLSGTTTLHIGVWVPASSTCDLGDRIAGVLRDVAGRIDVLRINLTKLIPGIDKVTLPLPLLQSKLLKDCEFSALHTLFLAIPYDEVRLGDVDLQVDAFALCPRLRRLSLREETNCVEFILPYLNLTTIYAHGGRLDWIINQLEHTDHVNFDLSPPSPWDEHAPEAPFRSTPQWQDSALESLRIVHLRVLYFDIHPGVDAREHVFLSLHARSLRTLELDGSARGLVSMLTMMSDIALRGLYKLEANCVRQRSPYVGDVQEYMDVMARMPALRVLNVSEWFGHYALRAITERDDLLPALEVLQVSPELLQQDCEKVVCFARGRQNRLTVEIEVSEAISYNGRREMFLPDLLESKAAFFCAQLFDVAYVRVT
ncbi:hypothetical protein CYLTODRAFT_491775 [Cylindrobasidium torrendii FP15055 ss-10]|uniref:Uncharacterized protein n=1 Tax=Cylindrobasidium torrendii FP15055 ss-10 TaxID=1314674 RepID=A0A0D7B696_9AGAR|nr:hypothetical protein CYLTODRAFT_491775 [Cylindrobasidium torrendii FP15055 ss-10]